MRNSLLFLPVGFLIGFAIMYLAVKGRDFPVVVRESAPSFESENQRIADLEAQLEVSPNNFLTLVDLGNLYITVGGYDRAAELLRQALQIAPGDPDVKADLGLALYNSGRVTEAVTQFEETLEIQPNHPQTLFNMGVVMIQELNDPEGAIEYWERMIELNPGHPQIPLVQEQIDALRRQF